MRSSARALTHWIGSPLVELDFQQQRFEADFRFNLVRARENSEQIALLKGESADAQRLAHRFGRVVENWYGIMSRTKRLTAFTASYSQAAVIFPYILVAPAYFADKIQLGGLMQTASAFGSVQKALSFFVTIYRALAEWRAVVARLDGFETSIEAPPTLADARRFDRVVPSRRRQRNRPASTSGRAAQRHAAGRGRRLQHPQRRAHAGHRARPAPANRRCSALSPASGRSATARSRSPPMPRDDAAAAAVFSDRLAAGGDRLSCGSRSFSPDQVADACRGGLAAAAPRLDEEAHWNRMLSLGEQQRLGLARALLHAPHYLFLDEATASLDEASEAALYGCWRRIAGIHHRLDRPSQHAGGLPPAQCRAGQGRRPLHAAGPR